MIARLVCLGIFAASPALAQSVDPKLLQLELDGNTGYAVVIAPDGNEHYCDARVTREAVDLGPCKPLRLTVPLGTGQTVAPANTGMRESVIGAFEQFNCTLSYAQLEQELSKMSELRRKAVAREIAEMTASGEIADDVRNERAVLRVGSRCS